MRTIIVACVEAEQYAFKRLQFFYQPLIIGIKHIETH